MQVAFEIVKGFIRRTMQVKFPIFPETKVSIIILVKNDRVVKFRT